MVEHTLSENTCIHYIR